MAEHAGFWSYVRQDDEDTDGRIVKLAHDISKRVRLLTGHTFEIFIDREDIAWGDRWAERIDEALESTQFLIPIITPSYFNSEACRQELLRFAPAAKSLELTELIMPLYYVTVPGLEDEDQADEAKRLIQTFQREDFRTEELEDANSSTYRKGVDRIARALIDRADDADAKSVKTPTHGPTKPAPGEGVPPAPHEGATEDVKEKKEQEEEEEEEEGGEEEEAGFLERLAESEAALPKVGGLIERIGDVLVRFGHTAEARTSQIEQSDSQGKGFAGRLRVAREFAKDLARYADELNPLVRSYMTELVSVDSGLKVIFRILRTSEEPKNQVRAMLSSIADTSNAAIGALRPVGHLADTLKASAHWSKELRAPTRRVETSLRQLADSEAIYQSWLDSIQQWEQDQSSPVPENA